MTSTSKVTLGLRKANADVKPGSVENHYGHSFIVQEDLTLVCDMDDVFVGAEVAAGRVKVYEPAAATAVVDPPAPKVAEKPKGGKRSIEVTPPPDTGADA